MMAALSSDGPELPSLVRKALAGKNNFLAAKAAKVAAERHWRDVVPDLEKAFDRFFTQSSDPQCWAKNAISKALAELEFEKPQPYLRGLRHVQMEPIWGGQADTAATLRGQCALALVQCRGLSDLDVLACLVEVLVDPDKTVRAEAARAVARLGRPEGGLLLRLQALAGDREPEVMGTVFSALLELDRADGIPFVGRFLDRDGEVMEEAAIALGLTHEQEALRLLRERYDVSNNAALLRGMALTRLPEAVDLLLAMVSEGGMRGRAAREALKVAPLPEEAQRRLAQILEDENIE
jgi:hypothetical protein